VSQDRHQDAHRPFAGGARSHVVLPAKPEGARSFPGQHLLSDKRLARRIVSLAENHGRDIVIDIGAGAGALTIPLAEQRWRILAVESDPALADKLRRRLRDKENVRILQEDFLRMHLPRKPFRVVSNIPFSITTATLGRLLDQPSSAFQGGVIIVELGAAFRFTRDPITDPRILGWRTWFDLEVIRSIPAGSFSPPPRVDAAILSVKRRNPPLVPLHAHARFMSLVKGCLRAPYSPAIRALRGTFTAEQVKRLVRRLQVDRSAPICFLDPLQWALVYDTMCHYVEPCRWPRLAKQPADRRSRKIARYHGRSSTPAASGM
jgi:23S rRNA (adenine-N6)-dimethyltransferase